jgi:hypothetical protein
MPRTTGSFDIAFGALEARLRIAIRMEAADLLAAERKRGGARSTHDAVSRCPLPMRRIHLDGCDVRVSHGGKGGRGEQGHYGLYRQSAGPQPNVWFCLFLTNGAMREKVK